MNQQVHIPCKVNGTFSISESRESLLAMPSGELTSEARAETKLACAMPCKEEED